MRNCKDCQYWIKPEKDAYDPLCNPTDWENDEVIPQEFEVRYCKSPKLLFYERPPQSDYATVIDGSEYKAELITGPNFGCVNFANPEQRA